MAVHLSDDDCENLVIFTVHDDDDDDGDVNVGVGVHRYDFGEDDGFAPHSTLNSSNKVGAVVTPPAAADADTTTSGNNSSTCSGRNLNRRGCVPMPLQFSSRAPEIPTEGMDSPQHHHQQQQQQPTSSLSFDDFADFDSPEAVASSIETRHQQKNKDVTISAVITPERQQHQQQQQNHQGEKGQTRSGEEIFHRHNLSSSPSSSSPPIPSYSPSLFPSRAESFGSYDSNDTPTTCNGHHQSQHPFDDDDKEVFSSPNNRLQHHHQQRMGRRRNDGKITKEELYNSLPPKTIMQRSLSLGDSLSPNGGEDEEEEDDLDGIHGHNHHISTSDQQQDDYSPRIESLRIPTIASPSRVREQDEEKKNEDDGSVKDDNECESSNVSNRDAVKPRSSPPRSKNDGGKGRQQSQLQQTPIHSSMNCNTKKMITPHPFFWRSHPKVTVKSYHFQKQQHRPRIRRIVPKMARVPSGDDASSFISSFSRSRIHQRKSSSNNSAACRFDNADDNSGAGSSDHYETTNTRNDDRRSLGPIVDDGGESASSSDGRHYSPYIHPAVVRRMWMESQSVSSSSASFSKQVGQCPESSAGSSFTATSSALEFLETIKKSLGEAIQL